MKKELVLQNPWWENKNQIFKDDKVKVAEEAAPGLKYNFIKENVVLLGPRQVGKTTYLKLFIKKLIESGQNERNITYFSCEPLNNKNDLINLFQELSELLPSEGKKFLFLDEVSSVEGWEQAIKYLLEQKIISKFQLVCTGSNAYLLKKGSERFPGRNIEIKLFLPLTFSEYVKNLTDIPFTPQKEFNIAKIYQNCTRLYPHLNQIQKEFNNYLRTGGVPKPLYEYRKTKHINSETYEIYTKWILGGLAKLNKKESIFRSLIKGIVMSYSSQVSLSSLAKDFQIPTHSTVETYLEVLSQLLLINVLYQIDPKNKIPLFRKNKKIYFQDPFFYNAFKGYVFGKFKDYTDENEDKIVEGIACQELASLKRTKPEINDILWYCGTEKETDFVMKAGEKLRGLEVKWSNSAESSDLKNRFFFKERIILSKGKLSYDKEKKVYIMPLNLFLLSLPSSSKIYL